MVRVNSASAAGDAAAARGTEVGEWGRWPERWGEGGNRVEWRVWCNDCGGKMHQDFGSDHCAALDVGTSDRHGEGHWLGGAGSRIFHLKRARDEKEVG
jgi:hypothetical protein